MNPEAQLRCPRCAVSVAPTVTECPECGWRPNLPDPNAEE